MDTQLSDLGVCEECNAPLIMKRLKFMETYKDIPMHQCDCLKKQEQQENFYEQLKASNIPKIFIKNSMSDWKKIYGSEDCFDDLNVFWKDLTENINNGKGLMIVGQTGVGKTKMICWLLRQVIEKVKVSSYFISSNDLSIKLGSMKEGSEDLKRFLTKLTGVKVLVMDDIGESDVAEWRLKFISNIIDKRCSDGLSTFFTSMKSDIELKRMFGEHIFSRIMSLVGKNILINKSVIDMRSPFSREKFLDE